MPVLFYMYTQFNDKMPEGTFQIEIFHTLQ